MDKRTRILLVDDEDDIRMIAEISLRDVGGFETMTAESGAEGIATAIAEQPDLILLDMMMPHMDGMQTLERLRGEERTRKIPVIFMTARAQRTELETYVAAGAVGVVTKPFDPMQLANDVRRIVEDAARTGR